MVRNSGAIPARRGPAEAQPEGAEPEGREPVVTA